MIGQEENGFNPSFPPTCPYVTAVGATQVNPGAKVTDPESACRTIIRSGGGFSNHFAMPGYQKRAVDEYMKDHRPMYPDSQWNSTGSRGYPDISANGCVFRLSAGVSIVRMSDDDSVLA